MYIWESGEMSVCKGKANSQSLHGLRNISTKQCHSQMQATASLQGHVRKKPYMNMMQKCHSDSKLIQTEVFCAKKKSLVQMPASLTAWWCICAY